MTQNADDLVERGFMLGIAVAEHVHNVRRSFRDGSSDRILEALEAIARGDLTLIDTPEEVAADSNPPASVRERLAAILRDSRQNERRVAHMILKSMFGDAT